MVVHRRGGRPSGGGRRKQRAPARRRSQSTSDENSSDGGSITRCVCGETHSVGLMVQCDKCEVWQHCECMGLEQPDIPDHYYCEQCKPENHKSLRQHNGRTKRQYVSTERAAAVIVKAPKKRMTLNSREASMSLEDVLAARSALEMYESHKDGDSPPANSPPPTHTNESDDSTPTHQDTHMEATTTLSLKHESSTTLKETQDTTTLVKSTKRKRDLGIKLPDTIDEKSEPPSSTVSSVGHDEPFMLKEQEDFSEPDRITPKPSTSATTVKPKRKQAKSSERKANGRINGKATASKRGKPRSRTSTPVRESSPMACSELDDDTGKESPEDGISSVLFDHFSSAARASSPPAKTRQPHARMSISEMNRRANQILEYISSIQVEMASKETDNRAGHGNTMKSAELSVAVAMQQHHGEPMRDDHDEDDDNDSLSSASTIPLNRDAEEDDDDLLEPVDKDKQSSMEIMDMLTRKLIKFQRRFGSRNRTLYEDALMECEGRMTRSREASSNVNTAYRNMMAH